MLSKNDGLCWRDPPMTTKPHQIDDQGHDEVEALRKRVADLEASEHTLRQENAELRQQSERFRAIAGLVSDYAYVLRVEPNGWLIREWVTEALPWITGYPPEEFEMLDIDGWINLVHPDDRTLVEHHRQTVLSGVQDVCEHRIITKQGGIRWLRDYSRAERDPEHGRVTRIVGAIQDITAAKRTEQALAEERNLLRTLIDHLPDHIYVKDTHSRFLLNNRAMIEFMGAATQADLAGKTDFDFHPPELAEQYYADEQGILETGHSLFSYEEPIQDQHTGKTGWFISTKLPFRNQQGEIIGIMGIARDITERKQIEEELNQYRERLEELVEERTTELQIANSHLRREIDERRRAEEKLRREHDFIARITEMSPVGIVMISPEGHIVLSNQRATHILGLTKDEIAQRSYNTPEWRITDYEGRAFPDKQLPFRQVITTGQPVSDVRHAIEWPDGRRVLLSVNAAPIFDERGQIDGIIATVEDVTERVHMEQALRDSEERYRSFVQNFQGIAYRGTLDFRPIFFHGAVEAITGYTEQELLAGTLRWDQLIHPEDRPGVYTSSETLQTIPNASIKRQYRIVRKDGEIRWVQEFIQNLCDASGVPTLVQGSVYDITEQKEAEEAVRENEDRLQQILEQMPYPVEICDPEGTAVLVNQAFLEMFGIPSADFIVGHYNVFKDQTVMETLGLREDVERAYQGEVVFLPEVVMPLEQVGLPEYGVQRKDTITHEVTMFPVFTHSGDVWQVVNIWKDITDRKRFEEDLRLFKAIVEASQEAVAISDQEGNLLYINPAHEQLFSRSLVESRQLNYRDYYPPESLEVLEREVVPALIRGESWEGVLDAMDATGRRFPLWERAGSIHDETGALLYGFGFMHDDSLRKQAEEELQRAKETAEAANRAKSEFLANTSHELRTPLNAILGYAQLLKRDQHLTDQQRRGLETIQHSGEHLLALINDILDLAKIEANKLEAQPVEFHLPSFLHQTVAMYQMKAEQKGLSFSSEYAPDLPTVVSGDKKLLRQILLNLFSNAIKFTESGGVTFRVKPIHPPPSDSGVQLRFEVEDTGIGIVPEQLDRIFLPFEQVHDRRFPVEGTGLGLAISHRLARVLGTDLDVHSVAGQGSRFWIDLRLPAVSADDQPTAEASEPLSRITGYTGEPRTILVVDDHADTRAILHEMLDALGFQVLEARDGREGIEQTLARHPDLILADIYMPGLDGLAMVQRLHQLPIAQHPRLIALSASTSASLQHECTAAGFHDFLEKPISQEALLHRLQIWLELDWIYARPSSDRPAVDASSTSPDVLPTQEELQDLWFAARRGDLKELREEIDTLEQSNPALHPFTAKLRELSYGFQINKIRQCLTRAMEQP
ncbi:PAS domain S-box protein [candidate division KSB3 bacterium]|uniref:histidine kinase n=1 Tax=candidate division KSB3 bacterium TaxID=2044937 RepID=A0A9D5Q5X7_9BACT|nr:PAS domain S-box protein [candidate division KSB3 bacterium]MBD3324702.1 PAS domain S-box protein [candidate division KSB3 bacterium]